MAENTGHRERWKAITARKGSSREWHGPFASQRYIQAPRNLIVSTLLYLAYRA